jgi:hypothetical protein
MRKYISIWKAFAHGSGAPGQLPSFQLTKMIRAWTLTAAFALGLILLNGCASRSISLASNDRASLKRLGLVVTESMPEAIDGPYLIEQAPNSDPVIKIGMRVFSQGEVARINQETASTVQGMLKQSYAAGNQPALRIPKRLADLETGKSAISLEDLGTDASARWHAANSISNGLKALGPMLESKNCDAILAIHVFHWAGMEQFKAVPRAYAGMLVRIISPQPKDGKRWILYHQHFFSEHEVVGAPTFGTAYLKSMDQMIIDAIRRVHGDLFSR